MKGRTGSLETAVLKTRWRRWLKIVELFASERPARQRVDPEALACCKRSWSRPADRSPLRPTKSIALPDISRISCSRGSVRSSCGGRIARSSAICSFAAGRWSGHWSGLPGLCATSRGSPDNFRVVFRLPLGVGPWNHGSSGVHGPRGAANRLRRCLVRGRTFERFRTAVVRGCCLARDLDHDRVAYRSQLNNST